MKLWSQPIRVETPDQTVLITSRTIHSALWFVNNPELDNHICGYLAKYVQKYQVELFNVSPTGNHIHLLARFPHCNRAAFMRDFNARVAEGVRRFVPNFLGGPLFERRYTVNILPLDTDIEDRFFYCALQSPQDGLSERIGDYPGYNGTFDAIRDRARKYTIINWGEYHSRKRFDKTLRPEDFAETYELRFTKLPTHQHLEQQEYEAELLAKLEKRRIEVVTEKKQQGHVYPTKEALRKVVPGSLPRNTKRGTMRPIVLCSCLETKQRVLKWYFAVVAAYLAASRAYRAGQLDVVFPSGTYPPSLPVRP